MNIANNAGLILLAIWLVASGLITVFDFKFLYSNLVMAIIAILSGILILFRIRDPRASINLGLLLLSVWLILTGLFGLLSVSFPAGTVVMAVLGLAAGVLLLLGQ